MDILDIIRKWQSAKLDETKCSPEQRRVIGLLSAGVATDDQMKAAGQEFVQSLKASPEFYRRSIGASNLGYKAATKEQLDNFTIPWVMSVESRDRDGDVIRQSEWDTKNFADNPVVLWGHGFSFDHRAAEPVGRIPNPSLTTFTSKDLSKTLPALAGNLKFAHDESEHAARLFRLAKGKFLNTGSVSFLPRKDKTIFPKDAAEREELGVGPNGVVFCGQELLEFSLCGVPSNPNAIQASLETGLTTGIIHEGDADMWTKALSATEKDMDKELRAAAVEWFDKSPIIVATPGLSDLFKDMASAVAALDMPLTVQRVDALVHAALQDGGDNTLGAIGVLCGTLAQNTHAQMRVSTKLDLVARMLEDGASIAGVESPKGTETLDDDLSPEDLETLAEAAKGLAR